MKFPIQYDSKHIFTRSGSACKLRVLHELFIYNFKEKEFYTQGAPDDYSMTPQLQQLAAEKEEEVAAALADDGTGAVDVEVKEGGCVEDGKKGGIQATPDDIFFVETV